MSLMMTACNQSDIISDPVKAAGVTHSGQSTTTRNVPSTIDSFFFRGAPEGLASFKVLESVKKITTLYRKSKNEKLNGKIQHHTLTSSLPLKGGDSITVFRMNNFYDFDGHENIVENLAVIRSNCAGTTRDELLEITQESVATASKICKKGLSKLTGRLPFYTSQKDVKTPFYITCRNSDCKLRIVKWNRIGFDILIRDEHLSQGASIANASYKHIDKMLKPISK